LYLLASLLALLLLYPLVQDREDTAVFMFVMNSAILVAGVFAVSDRPVKIVIAASIGGPQIVLTAIVIAIGPSHPLSNPIARVASILLIVYFAYTIVLVAAHVLRNPRVNRDTLYGALSIYLLMGLSWAGIYSYIMINRPGSFAVAHGEMDAVYFSFTTLTTLGYGDIVPVTTVARSLAILEAIAGVIFMAVAIARLVSLYRPEAAPAEKQP
jgi:hypothetical protein